MKSRKINVGSGFKALDNRERNMKAANFWENISATNIAGNDCWVSSLQELGTLYSDGGSFHLSYRCSGTSRPILVISGMLELRTDDRLCAAPGVADPFPGCSQRLLCRGGIRSGQRARDAHSAADRSSPHRRPYSAKTPPQSGRSS